MSQEISWDLKVPLINKLMIQMMWSGYNLKDRKIVAKRIVAKCDNDLTNLHREGRQVYRSKQDRKTDIKPDKSTWFRKAGATTTLQVPNTHNSQLAKTLWEVIKKYLGPKGTNVKVIEKPGLPIMTGLYLSDPFPSLQCNRGKYPIQGECNNHCTVQQ